MMSDNSRRKLIKTTALGGVILGAAELQRGWVKPVVESVTLPAHAATTAVSATGAPLSYTGKGGVVDASAPSLVDALVSTAHAGQVEPSLVIDQVCIRVIGEGRVSVSAEVPGAILSAGEVQVGGSPVSMAVQYCSAQASNARGDGINPLDVLGVIPAAHAGIIDYSFEVQVDSAGSTAQGTFFHSSESTVPFSLPAGACPSPICEPLQPE